VTTVDDMDSTTDTQDQATRSPGELIKPVLSDLEAVVANVKPGQFGQPTPCSDFDVETLRSHILSWTNFFGFAFADPEGTAPRPDPETFEAPADPGDGAAVIASAAQKIGAAIDAGVENGSVKVVQSSMPGSGAVTLVMWEALMHGHDLAAATGQAWQPADEAAQAVLGFAQNMLTDEYRGPGKDFGPIVPVTDDATALDRLLGFSGRDPGWTPATN
jgi:uncharacterized protein (TIGR03086 family)